MLKGPANMRHLRALANLELWARALILKQLVLLYFGCNSQLGTGPRISSDDE